MVGWYLLPTRLIFSRPIYCVDWSYIMLASFAPSRPMVGTRKQRGQGLIEYALILILVAIAVVAMVGALGQTIETELYDNIQCGMADAMNETLPDC